MIEYKRKILDTSYYTYLLRKDAGKRAGRLKTYVVV